MNQYHWDLEDPVMDSIAHHGILGQKWGVRRFQDKSGRLTTEGRNRLKYAYLKSVSKAKMALGLTRKKTKTETEDELKNDVKRKNSKQLTEIENNIFKDDEDYLKFKKSMGDWNKYYQDSYSTSNPKSDAKRDKAENDVHEKLDKSINEVHSLLIKEMGDKKLSEYDLSNKSLQVANDMVMEMVGKYDKNYSYRKAYDEVLRDDKKSGGYLTDHMNEKGWEANKEFFEELVKDRARELQSKYY
jgi:hypothetical protein